MARYSGDYSGTCGRCGEPVEFAVGLDTQRNFFQAMHFGPGGPTGVEVFDWSPRLVTETQVVLGVTFACPVCGAREGATIEGRAVPGPQE
jgi:hypothetical protein